MVEHKNGGTCKPLSVELAPYGLSPTSVGHGEMYAVGAEVVPINASGEMSHGVEEVVSHHLRFAAGARGEIHEHRVAIVVFLRTDKSRSVVPFLVPVVEAFSLFRTYADKSL